MIVGCANVLNPLRRNVSQGNDQYFVSRKRRRRLCLPEQSKNNTDCEQIQVLPMLSVNLCFVPLCYFSKVSACLMIVLFGLVLDLLTVKILRLPRWRQGRKGTGDGSKISAGARDFPSSDPLRLSHRNQWVRRRYQQKLTSIVPWFRT